MTCRGMLMLSDTFLGMPVLVHELVGRALSEPERQPRSVNQRARLWHVSLPSHCSLKSLMLLRL